MKPDDLRRFDFEARRAFANQRVFAATGTVAAAGLLGLTLPATAEEVRAAYVRAVKAMHPDTGGPGGNMAPLKAARDTLLAELNHAVEKRPLVTCPMCLGRGSVNSGFTTSKCVMCAGKGYVDERS